MNRFAIMITTAAISCTSAFVIAGDNCDISINYDLVLEPESLQLIGNDQTRYQLSDGELGIYGEKIALTAKQQELVADYE